MCVTGDAGGHEEVQRVRVQHAEARVRGAGHHAAPHRAGWLARPALHYWAAAEPEEGRVSEYIHVNNDFEALMTMS